MQTVPTTKFWHNFIIGQTLQIGRWPRCHEERSTGRCLYTIALLLHKQMGTFTWMDAETLPNILLDMLNQLCLLFHNKQSIPAYYSLNIRLFVQRSGAMKTQLSDVDISIHLQVNYNNIQTFNESRRCIWADSLHLTDKSLEHILVNSSRKLLAIQIRDNSSSQFL